jgi:hypothetical protein
MKTNETPWTRRGAALLPTLPCLASSDAAIAASDAVQQAQSPAHAALLFAIVWFLASLRIRRTGGRWRFGFELSPLKRIASDAGRSHARPSPRPSRIQEQEAPS